MDPSFPRHKLVLPALALLLAAAAWLASGPVTSAWDKPCLSCHPGSRTANAHGSIACSRCHLDRGRLLGAANSFMLAEEVTAKVLGTAWGTGERIGNDACLRCHEVGKPLTAEGVRMSHREVLDAGWRCTECHRDAAHRASAGVPMSKCTSCHNGETAPASCETCHAERTQNEARSHDPEWSITHGPNWRQTHGMGTLSGCRACHESSMCKRCHKVDLPHPQDFGATHSAEAREEREACLSCHQATFCGNCHGMEMPHPATFLGKHWDLVKQYGPPACERCHVQSQCEECHARHAHPGRIDRLKPPAGMYREQEL